MCLIRLITPSGVKVECDAYDVLKVSYNYVERYGRIEFKDSVLTVSTKDVMRIISMLGEVNRSRSESDRLYIELKPYSPDAVTELRYLLSDKVLQVVTVSGSVHVISVGEDEAMFIKDIINKFRVTPLVIKEA